ncbi:MAG: hypothetical protein ACRCSL_16565 [Microbacterium sp.]
MKIYQDSQGRRVEARDVDGRIEYCAEGGGRIRCTDADTFAAEIRQRGPSDRAEVPMTKTTNVQQRILENAHRSADRARRHPGVVHGAILLGAGQLSAARALARRGEVEVVRGVNGGTVASWYARPAGSGSLPWAGSRRAATTHAQGSCWACGDDCALADGDSWTCPHCGSVYTGGAS